jgi:adenylate cyclase
MENVEIERKFLVQSDAWKPAGHAIHIRQGYLAASPGLTVRVRQKDDTAYLTIKAARDRDSRYEFEYRIPASDAQMMLGELCAFPPIEKTRFEWVTEGNTWEIDIFEGQNAGLIIAEIELTSPDQPFLRPSWLGPEVTHDPRFYNAYLYQKPFASWGTSYSDLVNSISGSTPVKSNGL